MKIFINEGCSDNFFADGTDSGECNFFMVNFDVDFVMRK